MINKLKNVPSTGKVMTLFWDFNGPILKHHQDHGEIVTNAWYCVMLEEDLKHCIHSKCKGMLTNGVVAS
jgi:hypothetical protein